MDTRPFVNPLPEINLVLSDHELLQTITNMLPRVLQRVDQTHFLVTL